MRIIFVDGYNVINNWPNLYQAKNISYEAARQQLIDTLQNYATYKGHKVILVFDAHMVKGAIEKKDRMGNLVVVFTKEGETADSYIEKAVNDIGRKSDISVVTSDSLEQQVVFQRGATRKSSIEFYYEINGVENNIRSKVKKTHSQKRNLLEDMVDKEIMEKLEKIRRSR